MTNGCYFNISHSHGLVACAVAKCYCSRERVCRSIASIDTKELEDMVREGKPIEVTCQFCDSIYTFEPEEILRERRGGDDDK